MNEENNTETPGSKMMAYALKIEEAALTAIGIYLITKYNLGLPVWAWVLLFFSPDISMLGYLVNTRIGAYCYNLFHNRAVALSLVAAGFITGNTVIISIGLLLFAHSSFDRMMGYGLKFTDDFKHTNLGWMGKKQ
jgi:Domain of unknown function (DUF4260)